MKNYTLTKIWKFWENGKKKTQKLITVHLIFSSWYSANKFGVRAKRLSHDFYAGLAKKKPSKVNVLL